ncbi:MAG: L-lactate dehydrogenase [Candidatus Buchananbacteria bacterium]|nr:L-lactate dehydrogenase [Candidatus Buchananbacteria bacterium]
MATKNKVTIIGAGQVGSTAAYSLVSSGITEEIALIDLNVDLVKAEVMDLQHSVPFWGYTKVKVGSYKDVADSQIAIITCGARQKEGETRIDLVKKNSAIIKEIVPQIFKANPNVILIMVTNPVDVLTYQAIKMFPSKKKQIIGSGTMLDSARLRFLLSEKLSINPSSIHAYIVGEHGDSELPLWSTAAIGNSKLDQFKKLSQTEKDKIFNQAKNAAYAIIAGKQCTNYAIGAGINQLVTAILYNRHTVLPVSHLLEGEYGIKDVCLSLPAVVGCKGLEQKLVLEISAQEKKLLKNSADCLKKINKTIN